MAGLKGLKVGHVSHRDKGTGLSVFLFDKSASGSYIICGAGPASHELAPLDPESSVNSVHGLLLSGGSAFGLYAGKGVMQYLAEHNIGLNLPHGVVPIVPCAAIYDLSYKAASPPTDQDAYQACVDARETNTESGRIGAGTGATVGKIVPEAKRMTGGLGRAEVSLPNGLQVVAYAVVNAVGDIRDAQNNIVAGARKPNGDFIDSTQYLLSGQAEQMIFSHMAARNASNHSNKNMNTTLVAVFTNALFNKSELKRLARMSIAGMARAINPVFTCYDGDILFCVSLGEMKASLLMAGSIAAEAVRLSILNAVKHSEIVS